MAKTGSKKRYADKAATLLADLVECLESADFESKKGAKAIRNVFANVVNTHEGLVTVAARPVRSIDAWSSSELATIATKILHFLTGIVTLRDVGEGTLHPIQLEGLVFNLIPMPRPPSKGRAPGILLQLDGPAEDLLWFGLINLIRAAGVDRLQFCSASDCARFHGHRRLYARVGRREFCSTRCQKRIYMRGYKPDPRKER